MGQGRVATDALLADIRKVARLLGRSPSSVEYARHGQHDVSTVRRRFRGASWAKIIQSMGLRYARRTCARVATDDELRKDLLRVAGRFGRAPTRGEYERLGRHGAETVRRRSGRRRWEEAVASLCGLDPEEVKLAQAAGGRRYRATGEWLERLQELSAGLGRAPTRAEANGAGINPQRLCLRVGGGWEDVLRAAGVDGRGRTRLARLRATPTAALIEDVRRVAFGVGRAPTMREYGVLGRYPPAALRGRLGGWKAVKRALVEGFG